MSKSKKSRRPIDWSQGFNGEFMDRLIDLAHKTSRKMARMSFDDACRYSHELVDDCDVVFAVCPDEIQEDVWNVKCIKGAGFEGVGDTGALLVESKKVADLLQRRIESWRMPTHTTSGTYH